MLSVSFRILKPGLLSATRLWNSVFFFRLWISLSSVIMASQWFIADERIKQSIKSFSMFLSLKDVSKMLVSWVGIVSIASL